MSLKASYLLVQNIKALLRSRGVSAADMAFFCRHKPAWASKILAGQRGIALHDFDTIADFFGITVDQLFRPGIAPVLERRRLERRHGPADRRKGDRRVTPPHAPHRP